MQAAIEHWAPRFISNGIDYNDFVRTTGRLERWEDWLSEWAATAEEHLSLAAAALDGGLTRSAGEAYLAGAVCLHFAKFVWVLDPELHHATTSRSVAAFYSAHEQLGTGAERIVAPLEGASVCGNLRWPGDGSSERPPLVLLIPGLDSTKEEFFWLEEVFLARGMATLSMDGPGQGESGFALPIRPDYEMAVAVMLDALAGRGDLDLDRVGAFGVSLGGYYAPRAAAFEPRLRAVVGVSGAYAFGECWDDLPPLTRETFRFKSGAGDDREARELARELSLQGVAERISQPALMITGRLDRIIAWQQTERIAREVPNARFVLYDEGTHVCNNLPYRYRPLAADWLREQLLRA